MITLNSNGFFFFSNGRFINPKYVNKNHQVHGYKLAHTYVQIIKLDDRNLIKLVKQNIPPMKGNYNKEYYNNKPWKYVDKYDVGSFSNPYPSGIVLNTEIEIENSENMIHRHSCLLKVHHLTPELGVQFFFFTSIETNAEVILQYGELQHTYRTFEDYRYVDSNVHHKPKIKLVSLSKQVA